MFNITANEAREFQRKGFDQDEVVQTACFRCQQAVVDQSKKGKNSVEVAVFDLTDKSFENLKGYVLKHGFEIKADHRHNERTHSLTICWGKE